MTKAKKKIKKHFTSGPNIHEAIKGRNTTKRHFEAYLNNV